MDRRKVGSRESGKKIIRVLCEGESEQAYTEDVVAISERLIKQNMKAYEELAK